MIRMSSRWARPLAIAAVVLLTSGLAATAAEDDSLVEALKRHVGTLAADDLEGRLTGSAGAAAAADYIVGQLEAIGAVLSEPSSPRGTEA